MNQGTSHIDWEKLLAILEKDAAQQPMLISDLSDEEKEVLTDLQQLKDDKALLSAMQLDSKQAWNKVAKNLDNKGRVISGFRWMRSIAAACLLIIAGTAVFFWFNNRSARHYKTVAEALAGHTPTEKVQLIMANGKKIEANAEQELKEKDGTAIEWKQGQINYGSNPSAQKTDGSLLTNTLIVPRGHVLSITLSDGTRIWMNADSKLRFPVQFSKAERRIELEGEAYLEVKHSDTQPFIVQTGNTETKVLGTSFDIKAYGNRIYTTLVTGRVSFRSLHGNEVVLMPGQQAVFGSAQDVASVRQVPVEQWIAWKNNELIMDKMPLWELAEMLERRYDVHIAFADERLKNIEYDAALDLTGNIVDLLENLEKAANIRFVVKDKTILIEPSPI